MSIEIKVPPLPESVADATLVVWHRKQGDTVSRDENIADLETDKVVLEVPAPASGILLELKVQEGSTVTAGDLLAILEQGDVVETTPVASVVDAPVAEVVASKKVQRGESAHKLSPSVRRLLDEHDLDPTIVVGSGKDGRITKSDVMAYLKSHSDEDVSPGDPTAVAVGPGNVSPRSEQRVPMTRLRAVIANRMVEAQQAAAMLTTFNEVDLGKVISLRGQYKEPFLQEHGVKLGFMSFFAKAAVEALKKYPVVNASVEDTDIVYHDYYDIGIAVSSERGLMVPVVRDVDRLSFAGVESAIADLGSKARDGTISMEDLTGGTFTITNGGIFGSMLSTPILNPPQSAILGMHNILQRPMAVNGEVAIRSMMYLALTYDHRIIDGKEAVQFLVSIKQSLEDPGRMLLQV